MQNGLRLILLTSLPALLLASQGWAQAVTASPLARDSTRRTERLLGWQVTRPKKAALLSAVLPGAGQIYNRKFWKLPLVYGAIGGAIIGEQHYQRLYQEYTRGYEARMDGNPKTIDKGEHSGQEVSDDNVYAVLKSYRTSRDQWIGGIALAYTLNIVDALVDAHLYDFDISNDLSLHWEPSMLQLPTAAPTPGIAFSLHLKSNR
ncbi:DUF5683 domain-containing protein [Hymenobacter sp. DG25B]|jgi:hypothetical protein|uniref:DUF5683 domain-containing protein n=1 Tax=Hymenobacter sp. DG25B TaxID=1385664 RepID=UPI000661FD12|nr:DUF5683 domain-containing protein [Hymenobacter sp. DG25B]